MLSVDVTSEMLLSQMKVIVVATAIIAVIFTANPKSPMMLRSLVNAIGTTGLSTKMSSHHNHQHSHLKEHVVCITTIAVAATA